MENDDVNNFGGSINKKYENFGIQQLTWMWNFQGTLIDTKIKTKESHLLSYHDISISYN